MHLCTARALAASILLGQLLLAQEPVVTATKRVENWETKGKKYELLRKINNRWWTEDDREVYPPGPSQVFWTPDSKPGTYQFFHHRPFQLTRAESLHLFMSPQEVEAALGKPNRMLGDERHAFWLYYAANGTKLNVRFMGPDGLGDAVFIPLDEKSRQVPSIASELNGRSIYKILAERANQRVQANLSQRMEDQHQNWQRRRSQPNVIMLSPVPVAPDDPSPLPSKRIIPAESYAALSPDATRDDILTRLGEPNSRSAFTDDQGRHESLTYDLDSGESVVIHLLNGKVTALH